MSAQPITEPPEFDPPAIAPLAVDSLAIDPKEANVVYHDWEAETYDEKWSISFDERCIDYAVGRFAKALGGRPRRFEKVLEVGCGTGFFLLNVAQAGYVGEAHATDISSGMVDVCVANGRRRGIEVEGRVADAERLPYADATFDLVMGHAFVHHIPDLDAAFAEMLRVLKPGGRLIVAGEPTFLGDAVASQIKRGTRMAVKGAAALLGQDRVLAPMPSLPDDEMKAAGLEWHVDLHIFTPRELRQLADTAGFAEVETITEELTANWFGWVTRTAEAMLRPDLIPQRYPLLAYRIWKSLFWADEHVLRHVVPSELFYNAILTAVRPSAAARAGSR